MRLLCDLWNMISIGGNSITTFHWKSSFLLPLYWTALHVFSLTDVSQSNQMLLRESIDGTTESSPTVQRWSSALRSGTLASRRSARKATPEKKLLCANTESLFNLAPALPNADGSNAHLSFSCALLSSRSCCGICVPETSYEDNEIYVPRLLTPNRLEWKALSNTRNNNSSFSETPRYSSSPHYPPSIHPSSSSSCKKLPPSSRRINKRTNNGGSPTSLRHRQSMTWHRSNDHTSHQVVDWSQIASDKKLHPMYCPRCLFSSIPRLLPPQISRNHFKTNLQEHPVSYWLLLLMKQLFF